MSEKSSSLSQLSESQQLIDRLKKKYKQDQIKINLNPDIDINQLAIDKYKQIKKKYNFISEDEVKNTKQINTGNYEKHMVPIHNFNQEMYSFRRDGFCVNPNPNANAFVFADKNLELQEKVEVKGQEINEKNKQFITKIYPKITKQSKRQYAKLMKSRREKVQGSMNYLGPWAGYGENLQNGSLTQEQRDMLQSAQERKKIRIQQAKKEEQEFQPYSVFHWKDYHDYKGQSYVDPPTDNRPFQGGCYIPKKDIQTWVGSQKAGYHVGRFFPKVGHFFLTGNAEGKIHLFDVMRDRTCAHTYTGHAKAIRDIKFTNDGKHFLSCGFDGQIHYWDTQYGKGNLDNIVVQCTFRLKRLPFCLQFHPLSEKQNSFLCGSSNKKIMQFDLNTGTKSLEYNQHLGTVNTVTFLDENKFVSSSDDKKVFVWQFGIPVATKHVSEPQMHTITATTAHPSGQYFLGQSSDNQIVVYENKGGNFRRIRSKKFASHFCAGYACAIDFSPDGQFIVSGDERGRLFFYDWKTCKNYRTIDAHPSVCIGVEWHPNDPKKVITCGWQGLVKLWQ